MTDIERIARNYVAAANAHDTAGCERMFAWGAEYVSTGVGLHQGRAAIGQMMASFFGRFADVHWHTHGWRRIGPDGVAFDFHMTGNGLDRRGVESIWFDRRGLFRRVEVEG